MEQLSFIKPSIDDYIVDSFSADSFYPEVERRNIEDRYSGRLELTEKFNRQSVSYQLSKKAVLHSWLKYKEGFSADLVNILLDEMGAQEGDLVMDPFLGSGTTALVCQMRGINSIGYDILPTSSVAISAKSAVYEYDVEEIRRLLNAVEALVVPDDYDRRTPYIPITEYAYPEETEKYLAYISEWIDEEDYSDLSKNLIKLCIINSLERCSFTIKSGQYLSWDSRSLKVQLANEKRSREGKKLIPKKTVREEIERIDQVIVEELRHCIEDIVSIQGVAENVPNAEIEYINDSVLFNLPEMNDGILKGVITSPPYCNRYDYTRTYALELVYLGLDDNKIKDLRQKLLSCTVESKSKKSMLEQYYISIGAQERYEYILRVISENGSLNEILHALNERKNHGDLNNNGIIRMVEGYFTELAFVYAELYRTCQTGAMVAFVNDNVRYGGEVIPVDFISSSLAEQFGFEVEKIYCLKQQKGNSSQQMAKFGRVPLRKSITIWRKP